MSPDDELALLTQAAVEAGEMSLAMRARGLTTRYKPRDNSPVTDADLAVDAFLTERLRGLAPDYGWLSEETIDDPDRLARERIFVVDPIDGTRAYVKGAPWWSVSIAVVEAGHPVLGVVHAPQLGETYAARADGPALCNGAVIGPSGRTTLEDCAVIGDLQLLTHRKWPTPWPAMRIEARNSIAYRLCLVASGAFDAAITLSVKNDWDLAAGDLIATRAGAYVGDHRGRAFAYNRPRPEQASLVCATPGLAPLILERVRHIAP